MVDFFQVYRFTRKSCDSFSLIEVLIVTAIVSVLTAMMLPSLAVAKERARRAQCTNNLRQIGLGIKMYFNDQAVYPEGGNAGDPSMHYRLLSNSLGNIGSIFFCPSDAGNTTSAVLPGLAPRRATNLVTSLMSPNVSYSYVRRLNENAAFNTPLIFDRMGILMDNSPISNYANSAWNNSSPHKGDGGHVFYVGGQVKFEARMPATMGSAAGTNVVVDAE